VSATVGVGSRVGSYRIESELGRGGMGYVFLAEHVSLGRKAALKLLVPELAADEAFRERFVRESQLLAAIEHPNMIPIYDAGEADGVLFIAMRYVEGYDLKALISREGRLAPDRALEIVGQAAAALDAAHAREIVHRDVKPANILIDEPSGRTFLTDFGIAKQARTKATQVGLFIGTVDYAAPEQIEGRETGVLADVYALGCVLYEALTGERPYPRETDIAVVFAHLREPPPLVTAKRPELPPALDDVLCTALAKSEADRYQSCGELLGAAREALRTTPTLAARPLEPRVELPVPAPAARRARSNLPTPPAALVGRDDELAAVVESLRRDDVRLLTLTGPGGTGKTRLALEAGATLADDFPDGVFFVGLAALNDPALVLPAIAASLGVEERGDEVLEALRLQLADERLLLVLDNFEHLLPAAPMVSQLLAAAPMLKVLATSRSVLRVRSEREHAIAPLDLPDPDGDMDALAASPAVRLFVDRAQEVKPGFELTEENAASVAEICRRLDGLPLAIELAAARMKLLSPQAIASRLENRLQLLTGGARDLPSRHQTLRGTIDWSYELLDPAGKTLLARSAVFVDGFTFEAAEEVSLSGELDTESLVDALAALVDESLLRQREPGDGEVRFEMLETIREYALFRLIERGELDEHRRRHAAYYVRLGEAAEPELVGRNQAAWVRRLSEEAGNIRAALAWSLDGGDLESGLRLTGALFRLWSICGQVSEARRWLDQALARSAEVAADVRARALFAAGYSALGQGDFTEAVERFDESLRLYRGLGDDRGAAACLAQLGWLLGARGELERATAFSEKSLELARRLADHRTASLALSNLGDVDFAGGDYSGASGFYADALMLRREIGDRRIVADALLKSGRAEALRGNSERALRSLREGLDTARELGDGWTTSVALASLGFVALSEGDDAEADRLLGEALGWCRKRGDKRLAAECLAGLAAASAQREQHVRAARLWGAAEGLREAIGAAASPVEQTLLDLHRAGVHEALGDDRFRAEWTEGLRLDVEQAIAYAYNGAADR
jgi:predicted ATPase/predicted Ser/Thr protein kinase